MKGRCNQLIEDGTYPGLEAAIEEAIANAELANEEELATQMSEERDQKLLAAQQQQKQLMPPQKGGKQAKEMATSDTFPDHRYGSLLRLYDLLVAWDPEKHPRVESGEHGGEFTAVGGSGESVDVSQLPHAAAFVSPSVKSGMDFKTAEKELGSRQQVRLVTMTHDVSDKVGLKDMHIVPVIGSWQDGENHYAENSVMTRSSSDWDRNVLAGVMEGHVADQKAVLVFEQQADGKAAMVQFYAKAKNLSQIDKHLNKVDLPNHTLVPVPGGAMVYIIDLDGAQLDKINEAAQKYGTDNPVYYQFGKAAFIGNEDYGGTDREQRDRARGVYEKVIERSPVKDAQAIWKDVRDYWLPPYEQKGFDLTPTALISENPNIKHNSVRKEEAAKMMNSRAGKILQRDLGR